MADKVIVKKERLEGIGNAIREQEGSTEQIPFVEMEARIRAIPKGVDEEKLYLDLLTTKYGGVS